MTGPPPRAHPPRSHRNPWTLLFAAVNGAFIITVLMMVITGMTGKPPRLAAFFDVHGLLVLGVEVGVILGAALVMMGAERRATIRRLEEREAALLESASAVPSREPDREPDRHPDEPPHDDHPS
jgi:ABC-type Fe3+-siderophore transport system permease subunit